MTGRAWAVLAAALCSSSCAASLMKLPIESGIPLPDAGQILSEATVACRGIRILTAEIGVSGKIGGRGVRRGHLLVGLAAPASAYLDAPAPFGASAFIFAATSDEATLLLPRDRRVLSQGRPADILEAAAGVPLSPAELRETLTGCAPDVTVEDGRQIGKQWRVIRGASQWYLRQERPSDPWRLVAAVHREPGRPEWRAEFRDFLGNMPRTVRLASVDSTRFDLTLNLSQVEINVALDAATFRPRVPADYAPLTLEDLRAAGPLSDASPARHE